MAARLLRKNWWVDFQFDHVRYRFRSRLNFRAGAVAFEKMVRMRLVHGLPVESHESQHPLELATVPKASGRQPMRYAQIDQAMLDEAMRRLGATTS